MTLVLIGLLGGMITGISPCVLPVLPAVFLSSGVHDIGDGTGDATGQDTREVSTQPPNRRRPYLLVGGLVLSFSVFTLLGTLALKALPIPTGALRWAGLTVLLLLGIGMIVPRFQDLLERPFARIPQRKVAGRRSGFVLGLALGAVYVPCAGPVLAAIAVAGATGKIGYRTVVLTLAFAVGTAVPLLIFALAGRGVAERVRVVRERQRGIRMVAGVALIGLAVALTFNVTDVLQRLVPDYTAGVNQAIVRSGALSKALRTKQDSSLANCAQQSVTSLQNCGAAPPVSGISSWLGTPRGAPVSLSALKGKVVLVDFWAYSCINCQRAIAHVEAWYSRYHPDGFEVVGVHTPEYAFEHNPSNVRAGARRLHITYPIAVDNDYTTWNSYANQSWPADYLVDSTGIVRYASIGEGDYGKAEAFIRQLLTAAKPGLILPTATDVPDNTPSGPLTPETYLGSERVNNYAGTTAPGSGTQAFQFPSSVPADEFALAGAWSLSADAVTAVRQSRIRLNFEASKVYLDVGGSGSITVTVDGKTSTQLVSGAPNIYPVVQAAKSERRTLDVSLTSGLSAYSFTFG